MIQIKWFFFYPAGDGFDIIVRDTGAENGTVLAEGSVRGEDFKKFIEEILPKPEKPEARQKAKVDEKKEDVAVPEVPRVGQLSEKESKKFFSGFKK